jgi:hypothetical protein
MCTMLLSVISWFRWSTDTPSVDDHQYCVSTKSSSFVSIPIWELRLSPKFAGTSDVVYDAAPNEVGGQKSWLLLVVIIFVSIMILFIVSRAESPQCVGYYSDNNDENISANKIISTYRMYKKRIIYKKKKMSIVCIQSIWRKSSANHISIDPMLVADKSEVPKEAQDEELSAGMSYDIHTAVILHHGDQHCA